MKGSFSEEALRAYSELAAEKQGLDFAESDSYDFTRCLRPDGSAYGTGGRCLKGSETQPVQRPSGVRTNTEGLREENAAKQAQGALKEAKSLNPFNKKDKARKVLEASSRFVDFLSDLKKEKGEEEALRVAEKYKALAGELIDRHLDSRYEVYGREGKIPSRVRDDLTALHELHTNPAGWLRDLN